MQEWRRGPTLLLKVLLLATSCTLIQGRRLLTAPLLVAGGENQTGFSRRRMQRNFWRCGAGGFARFQTTKLPSEALIVPHWQTCGSPAPLRSLRVATTSRLPLICQLCSCFWRETHFPCCSWCCCVRDAGSRSFQPTFTAPISCN